MGRRAPDHIDDPRALGDRVRKRRVELGLSLRQLAFPGASASFISRVEAGARVPALTTVRELALRLDLPIEQLLGRPIEPAIGEQRLLAAEVAVRLGEPGAEENLNELLGEARALGDHQAESRLLEQLGLLALERRDDQQAINLLEAARAAEPRVSPRERPNLYRSLGRAYAGIGDLAHAVAILRTAFEDALAPPPDVSLMVRFGTYLANAFTDRGRFAEAEGVLADVVRHEADILDPTNRVRLEWALARTYAEQGQHQLAEAYCRRLLARLELSEEQHALGHAHLLLSGILLDRGETDQALEHLATSSKLLTDEAPVELALLSIEQARAALAQDDLDAAEVHARRALDQTEATEPGMAGMAYSILAEIDLARGSLNDARFLAQQAIDRLGPTAAPHYVSHAYEVLSQIEEAAGDLPAALNAVRARPAAEVDAI